MAKLVEELFARVIPYLGVSVLVGVVCWYLHDRYSMVSGVLLIAPLLVGYFYWLFERTFIVVGLCIIAVVFLVSYMHVGVYESSHAYHNQIREGLQSIQGTVSDMPDKRFDKQFVRLISNSNGYAIRVRLPIHTEIMPGDIVQVRGDIKKPEIIIAQNNAEFDYPRYLAVSNIIGEILRPVHFQVIGKDDSYAFMNHLFRFREQLKEIVTRFVPQSGLGLALGTTLGTREFIDSEALESYRIAGVSHIIVLSGFNITIIAITLAYVLGRLRLSPVVVAMVTIVVIWLFIAMVGFGASSVRAGTMVTVMIVAGLAGRQSTTTRSLLYAVVVLVLINPRIFVDDVGFQLSVLATAGLVWLSPIIDRLLVGERVVPDSFVVSSAWELYVATACATVATLPLVLLRMGTISGLGLIVNMLVVWVVPLIMAGVVAVILASMIAPALASAIGYIVSILANYINIVADISARISPYDLKTSIVCMLVSGVLLYWLIFFGYYIRLRSRSEFS